MKENWPAAVLAFALAIESSAFAAGPRFTGQPSAVRAGGKVTVRFAVDRETDAAVCVLNAKDEIVRHLAAGVLGKNAPEPFKASLLEQSIEWDGKDDDGRVALPAEGQRDGGFKVRVQLGMQFRPEKSIGGPPRYWDNQIRGVAVSPAGEVYVLAVMGSGYAGTRAFLRVLDGEGQYRRTIIPYPASLPPERTEPMGHILVDGRRLPLVCNAYSATLAPMLTGMPRQGMAWHPQGYLLLAGAVGSMDDMGPPRHVLAVDSEGGAPRGVGFVGPRVEAPAGHAAGLANAGASPDFLAVSPDGQWIYHSDYREGYKGSSHAVFRGRWKDAELALFAGRQGEPGDDDQHLRDPQGLATDAAGNVYVCDYGNNRLVILSPDGKRLATVAVDAPQQVAVRPGDGAIYVASRKAVEKAGVAVDATVRRFSPFGGKEPPRQVWSAAVPGLEIMALDPSASSSRLWLATTEKGRGMALRSAVEKDGTLELGPLISDTKGQVPVGIMAAGRDRNEVLVPGGAGFLRIDLTTGEQTPLAFKGNTRPSGEVLVGRDGNLYVQGGGGGQDLYRFDAKGEPLPFQAVGQNKLKLERRTQGLRGFCVTRDGTIYVLAWDYRKRTWLDSYDAQGKPARKDIVEGLASGATGVQVDAAGSIYITENIKPAGAIFPPPFAESVPASAWKWFDAKDKRPAPWCYTYDNAYMSFWAAVLKFPATGGTIYGLAVGSKPVAQAPADAPAFKSGYLARDAKVSGALWIRSCTTYAGSHDFGTDGPNCMCISSRMALDDFGRLYAPDPYRFCVNVLDSNGNTIGRIGSYGNLDSAGPTSRVPEPEIAFAWPRYVALMKDRIVVSDAVSRRLVVIGLGAAAESICEIK